MAQVMKAQGGIAQLFSYVVPKVVKNDSADRGAFMKEHMIRRAG